MNKLQRSEGSRKQKELSIPIWSIENSAEDKTTSKHFTGE